MSLLLEPSLAERFGGAHRVVAPEAFVLVVADAQGTGVSDVTAST